MLVGYLLLPLIFTEKSLAATHSRCLSSMSCHTEHKRTALELAVGAQNNLFEWMLCKEQNGICNLGKAFDASQDGILHFPRN